MDEEDKGNLQHVIEHLIEDIAKVSVDPEPGDLMEFGEHLDLARFVVSGIIYSNYSVGFVDEDED